MKRKKTFTLMEVIISVVLLSVVMITLFQIKSNNIFMISKSEEKKRINENILMTIDFDDIILNKNENFIIESKYKYENNEIRRELKDINVAIKDEKIDSDTIESKHNSIDYTTYYRTFSPENSTIKKRIYSFKFEL